MPQQRAEALRIDRLRQVVVGALLHRRDGRVDAALRGDQDEREVGELILDAAEQLEAVHARHHHVGQHGRRPIRGDPFESFLAIGGAFGFVAPGAHQLGQPPPGGGVVFDDEHSHWVLRIQRVGWRGEGLREEGVRGRERDEGRSPCPLPVPLSVTRGFE